MPNGAADRLVGLAYLSALADVSGDAYSDLLGQIILRNLADSRVALAASELAGLVGSQIGMQLPYSVVDRALSRRKYAVSVRKASGHYTYVGSPIDEQVIDRARLEREERHLVSKLREYSRQRYELEWTEDQARTALYGVIDRHAPALSRSHEVPAESTSLRQLSNAEQVVAASWINQVLREEPSIAAFLGNLVKGRVVGAALVSSRADGFRRPFKRTTLYFDTPEVLAVLGYHGDVEKRAMREGASIAVGAGARLAVLESTVSEVRNVILHAQYRSSGGPSRVQQHFVSEGIGPVQIRMRADSLERDIELRSLEIRSLSSYDASGRVDESALRDEIARRVQSRGSDDLPSGYDRGSAIDFDVRSLLSVFVARQREEGETLETARAVFISSNSRLVRVANRFEGLRTSGYDLCLTLHDFLSLMWLRNPAEFIEMPIGRLALECAAILAPSTEVWSQFNRNLAEMEEVGEVTADQIAVAVYSSETREEVAYVEAAGGDFDGAMTRATIEKLEARRNAQTLEERTRAEHLAGEVARLEKETSDAKVQLVDAEGFKTVITAELEEKGAALAAVGERLRKVSGGLAAVLLGIVVLMLGAGAVWVAWLQNGQLSLLAKVVGSVIAGVLLIAAVASFWQRTHVRLSRWLHLSISAWWGI